METETSSAHNSGDDDDIANASANQCTQEVKVTNTDMVEKEFGWLLHEPKYPISDVHSVIKQEVITDSFSGTTQLFNSSVKVKKEPEWDSSSSYSAVVSSSHQYSSEGDTALGKREADDNTDCKYHPVTYSSVMNRIKEDVDSCNVDDVEENIATSSATELTEFGNKSDSDMSNANDTEDYSTDESWEPLRKVNLKKVKRIITRKHNRVKSDVCEHCGYMAGKAGKLRVHIEKMHSKLKLHYCDSCNHRAKTKHALRSHALHKHTTDKPFECDLCEFKTKTSAELKSHINHRHMKEKARACPECSYKAHSSSAINSHIAHRHREERSFKCRKCIFVCKSRTSLVAHNNRKHCAEKNHICKHCKYAAKTRPELLSHISHRHKAEKPFSCTQCSYKTKTNGNLNRHILLKHSEEDEELFGCQFCEDYSAKTKQMLKSHVFYIHYNEAAAMYPTLFDS